MRHSNKNKGLSLVETLLTLAVATALGTGLYYTLKPATVSAKVKLESSNIQALAEDVQASFGFVGNYEGVNTGRVVQELLAPKTMVSGNGLFSTWGAPVEIGPSVGGGFEITYHSVPKEDCAMLASSASTNAYDILVNNHSLIQAGKFNPINAASRCSDIENQMVFVFAKDFASSAFAADPLDLPPPPPQQSPTLQDPETNVVGDPGGVPDATMTPPIPPNLPPGAVIPAPSIPGIPAATTPTTPIFVPAPMVPVAPPPTMSYCAESTEQAQRFCAENEWGTYDESRIYLCRTLTQFANGSLPEAWFTGPRPYTPWTLIADSGSCSTCPSPVTQNDAQWAAYTANLCAAGTYGYTNREQEQTRSRVASYLCPAGTVTLPAITYSAWTSWSNTGNNRHVSSVCTTCPGASSGSENQWIGYTANNCPAGAYGSNGMQREQVRSRSVSYNCPAGIASLPAPTYGAWSGWSDTGNVQTVSNACAGCPGASSGSENQWVGYTANNCPAGAYGSSGMQREQVRSRSISYVCPAGTASLPAPTYGAWSGWSDTGNTQVTSNACTSCPGAWNETQNDWGDAYNAACPSNQSGTITIERELVRTRTNGYNCPAGTASLPAPTYGAWGGWSNTGNTRVVSNSCVEAPIGNPTGYTWGSCNNPSDVYYTGCQVLISGSWPNVKYSNSFGSNPNDTISYACNGSDYGSGCSHEVLTFKDTSCASGKAQFIHEAQSGWYVCL